MRGLSNIYLHNLSKKLIGPEFIGVYPCDVFPKIRHSVATNMIIFNTGRANTEGEHFVAVTVTRRKVYYFDSFGEQPNNIFIKDFLTKVCQDKFFDYNRVSLQHDLSNFCGFYCLAYLLSVKKKMSVKRFRNLFSTQNKKSNDPKVIQFIVRNIKM